MMRMCYIFSVWSIILLFMIILTARHNILNLSENVQFFHETGYPMGPLIYWVTYILLFHNCPLEYGMK